MRKTGYAFALSSATRQDHAHVFQQNRRKISRDREESQEMDWTPANSSNVRKYIVVKVQYQCIIDVVILWRTFFRHIGVAEQLVLAGPGTGRGGVSTFQTTLGIASAPPVFCSASTGGSSKVVNPWCFGWAPSCQLSQPETTRRQVQGAQCGFVTHCVAITAASQNAHSNERQLVERSANFQRDRCSTERVKWGVFRKKSFKRFLTNSFGNTPKKQNKPKKLKDAAQIITHARSARCYATKRSNGYLQADW